MKQRMQWLDSLKGLGIIIIIIIHSTGNNNIYSYLGSFAVPLFFFVSGFLFRKNNYTGWPEFLFKRLKTRILPYIVWVVIFYFIVAVANGHNRGEYVAYAVNMTKHDFLVNFLVADFYWLANTIHNAPLWFLPSLFLVENIFYHLSSIASLLHIGLILTIFSFGANAFLFSTTWGIPYIVIVVVMQVLFYGFGFIASRMSEKYSFSHNTILILSVWIIFGIISIWGGVSLEVSLAERFTFADHLYRIVTAFSGIIVFALFSKYVCTWNWLRYIGANTLIILLIYEPLRRASNDIFLFISFNFFDTIFNNYRELFTVLQVITVLLLSVPCIYIINNYLPFLIAKKSDRNFQDDSAVSRGTWS